jgi:glycosyltransferase involved in cell wall biosynthesis
LVNRAISALAGIIHCFIISLFIALTMMVMRVAFLPVYPNPYQHLLARALAGEGIEVLEMEATPGVEWLRQERGRVQIMHLHWLSGLYMARWRTPLQMAGFAVWLLLAQRFGYRLVWTAHNVVPHVLAGLPALHLAIRRLVMSRADAVIVHCEAGRRELLGRFPRRKPVYVVPLGSYEGVYPVTADRTGARARLGLGVEMFVYLFLGNITAYKGLERFVEDFQAIAGTDDVAIIAGRNRDPTLVARLRAKAADDGRLRLDVREIADDEIQVYLSAADVMVAPFSRILTSSSVMTALSYGLPVIVPRLGCLPELVTAETGIIYDPYTPTALGEALREIKRRDAGAMGRAARISVKRLSWETIARQTAEIYRLCFEDSKWTVHQDV